MDNQSGVWKTNLSGKMAYQSFLPTDLSRISGIDMDAEGLKLLINANKELAYLEGITSKITSLPLFVSMYVRKEALLSSQIEGTQATLEDVLDPSAEINANRDVGDVINYIKATEYAIQRLNELPLCNRLIKEIHGVLMSGIRGQEKSPGEFRVTQNWIGGEGSTISSARYIPPSPKDMMECMSDLEKYINTEDEETDSLVKAALLHYQFETIHPFLDGNGRVGRLMITLFLMEQKIITTPAIYISYFLKKNRIEYYDRMTEVRKKGDYLQWIKFFLQANYESSKDAIIAINELSSLHDENIKKLAEIPRNQNLLRIFEYLEKSPIIEIRKTAGELDLAFNTVSKAITIFIELGILKENPKIGRTRNFSYEAYLEILKKDTI